ncbi:MAG: homoserine kinase [Flavobacteriia bacterium]|nr:MAG: homoserine kinase [Flavobacteriia bacterium]
MKEIKIFSPGTIANVSCGFDTLGCCLDTIGDEMIIRKTDKKGVHITKITGDDLPYETRKNVAGVAALALLEKYDQALDFGFEIEIFKNIKPGSGIGSSAASAAGAVFGINKLLNEPFTAQELILFASKGEELVSNYPIADNVAPALLGGFTLVKGYDPLKILKLPVMDDLYVTILHPQIEIKTAESRAILPEKVNLKDAVKQWANVGALVHALHTEDYNLFGSSLHDLIVEPYRSQFIPGFDQVVKTAKNSGALGSGISGSGPSIFSFCKGMQQAEAVKNIINEIYKKTGIPFHIYVSKINRKGIRII